MPNLLLRVNQIVRCTRPTEFKEGVDGDAGAFSRA
jgi:hypothetical protein